MFGLDLIVIIFLIYLLGMIFIGFIVYCVINNFFDYILGGCCLGSFVIVFFVGVLDMFGWLLMGLLGVIYVGGLIEVWLVIGLILGVYFNWKLVVGCLCV